MQIELEEQEVQLVVNVLAQQPYAQVAQLISKIMAQAAAAEAQPDPAPRSKKG